MADSSGDTSSRGVGRVFLKKTGRVLYLLDKEALFVVVKYMYIQEFMQ